MEKLWEPNVGYDASKSQSIDNMPYTRLYENPTREQLLMLIQDAKQLHWQILDLSKCGLDFLPDELWKLSNLQYLDLSSTHIRALPDSIGHLSNLQ